MTLQNTSTKWILFLSTHDQAPEDRHIYDLSFGIVCLEQAGINPDDIFIYIDGQQRADIESKVSIGTNNTYSVRTSSDFFVDLETYSHDNLVMFVTGHGGIDGIDAPAPITPYKLVDALKSSPDLKNSIVYLGQCYAGTFNYMPVSSTKESTNCVVLIGATGLHQSLSLPTEETFKGNNLRWAANVFLLHAFKWFSAPKDIDGDGTNTIMDSYKYAGVQSNRSQIARKEQHFVDLIGSYQQLVQAVNAANQPTASLQSKIEEQAKRQNYSEACTIYNVQQECWILNSIPAQLIEF
ncbi:hypothetical protein V6473_004540 [Vibrio parahaemolyticus]